MKIPPAEVAFHPLSIADPAGRVFTWRGELYRGVTAARADLYRDLFARGVFQSLTERGLLVASEPTDLELDGYPLVVRHRRLPVVSYAAEWPAAMLLRAGRAILDLAEALLPHGLTVADGHPFNVLFDGVHPWFVDLGSIVPARPDGRWPAGDEFRRFFVHPLQVMAAGHGRVARWLLHDHDRGVTAAEAAALCGRPPDEAPPLPISAAVALADARRALDQVAVAGPKTEWSTYFNDPGSFPDFHDPQHWTAKHRSVAGVLAERRPATLLDIGSNRGWFSQLAARAGTRVVATDLDEPALNLLCDDTAANHLPIHPLVMNFGDPLPGYGIDHAWTEPAFDRLRSDAVLALAVVHHMTHKQHLRFEHIASGLSALARDWAAVEFVAAEDEHVARWPKGPAWYTLAEFERCLGKHFGRVQRLPSDLPHRTVLVCDR